MRDDTPQICNVGLDGMLVRFGTALSEPANRAALALRDALEREAWDGIEETSSTLVSTFVRFDPLHLSHAALAERLRRLLAARDWYAAEMAEGRRLWRIPAVFGTELAPQLPQAAELAGLSLEAAIASLSRARLRVQTIGFAPGQPYLGTLPEAWDIPRQRQLSRRIPEGALAVAIRQLVLFSVDTPTGWLHVGQTAMQLFRPEAEAPFLLRPGDEVQFSPVAAEALENLRRAPRGGATCEPLS